jgi:hypothetical protein
MSVLGTLFISAWLAFNAALFAALWFMRPNPKLRATLFNWVVRGGSQRRLPPSSLALSSKSDAGVNRRLLARK